MKKGSLEIGVNFTVIMIIALIVLGLTLAFVLNVFNFANEKFPKTAPNIIFHASPDEPVRPDAQSIKVKPGQDEALLVSVYNNLWAPTDDVTLSLGDCKDSENNLENHITLSSISQNIETQEDKGYLTIIRAEDTIQPGTFICTLNAGIEGQDAVVYQGSPYHSTQIQIDVNY